MRKISGFSILLVLALQIGFAFPSKAQKDKPTNVRADQPVIWPSPEQLVRDLRSTNEDIRLKALDLIGESPSFVAAGPIELQLRIGEMGKRQTDVAIISVDHDLANWFAAVAVKVRGKWQRVETFECWCKYESSDQLNNFVKLESASDGENELVVDSSGGGTGLYEQREDRYRLRGDKLLKVMSFVSAKQECPGGVGGDNMCHLERRVFSSTAADELSVLIKRQKRIDPAQVPDVIFSERDLQVQYTLPISCKAFRWNEKEMRYIPAPLPKENPCQPGPKGE